MNPKQLKLLCFENVFLGLTCEISDCDLTAMAFLILKGERCMYCQKHFENCIHYHDGLDCFYTHDNGGRPFKVYVGEVTAHIYKSVDSSHIKSYGLIERIFLGTNLGKHVGNTILLKLGPQRYVYIGEQVVEFEIEDEIIEFHSYIGSSDVPCPVAVGTENVYFGPIDSYYPKSAFPERSIMSTFFISTYKEFLSSELRIELNEVTIIHGKV